MSCRKSHALQIRLTEEKHIALKKFADNLYEKRSRIVRKVIRELINHDIDLLTSEQALLKTAIRQLVGIANNLNQITMAMHAGVTHRTIDETYLAEIRNQVIDVRDEFCSAILKTKKRWVNFDEE